ncbi:hypothetical protein GX586_14375 [bacterium]|nr:hypothetical protein [bacterium]
MKRARLSLIGVLCIAAAAAHGLTLVNFDASVSNLTESYAGLQRPLAENSLSNALLEFSTATPLFGEGPPFYGGLHVVNSVSGGAFSTFRYHQNIPPSWPNTPMVFFSTSDESGGASFNKVNVIYLWLKADFANLSANPGITFSPDDELRMTTTSDWFEDWRAPGALFRFVVRDGAQYYVSEATTNVATMPVTFTLTNFNNNGAAGFRWAQVNLAAASFDVPDDGSLSFAAQLFTNVTAVGWMGRGAGAYYRTFGFRTFSASGLPEPAVLLCVAGLAALVRRATS